MHLVGAGNAPVYLHASADVPMAVVDLLISKTFDASVICPAEQTCVVDDAIHDAVVAELDRLGARVLDATEVERLAAAVFDADGRPPSPRSGAPVSTSRRWPGSLRARRKSSSRRSPRDLAALAAHPLLQEKLMPVLGLVRSPSVEHALASLRAGDRARRPRAHLGGLRPRRGGRAAASPTRIRTGRILVNAPTAVGALGGIYTRMPPTFSLGCGTWGGSTTTENINYRNLLNIKAVSRRQAPPQWFRVPSDTYFNAGALDSLRDAGHAARG